MRIWLGFLLVLWATHASAQPGVFSTLTVGASDRACFDGGASDWTTGMAPFLFEPYFSDANLRTVGIFVRPKWGTLVLTPNRFFSSYNTKLGDGATPIPAGLKGIPSGYQANIDSAQSLADVGSIDGPMGYGTTIWSRGGAGAVGYAAALTEVGVASNLKGFNVSLNKGVAGGSAFGFQASSVGPVQADSGLQLYGHFANGLRLGGNDVAGLTSISFATVAGANTPYAINGAATDTLRVIGGGSAGGMILDGAGGPIRFRAGESQKASIDTTTGVGAFTAVILTAPNGSCWRVAITNAGALTKTSVACP